jgi:hypothetical protein
LNLAARSRADQPFFVPPRPISKRLMAKA